MSIRSLSTLLLSLVALAVLPSNIHAQVLYGSLTGNVTDKSGAAIPNATVEATNVGTGIAKQTKTDDRGAYLIQDIQPGTYKVTISAPAFATTVATGVQIVENTVRRVDLAMDVANVGQSVTVAADAAVLQTDRADVNTQVSDQEVTDLPTAGTNGSRNFESMFVTIPGFNPPAAATSTAANPSESQTFYVNGSANTSNNMKLDGASDLYPWQPHIAAYIPPSDAIQTVSIVTNSFDAEQGNAAGSAINAIIKSGTNQIHGALWEYNTDSALKARNFFYYGANNPKNIVNQFGLDVGGPIKKNKLFYFVDWERTKRSIQANVTDTVATDAIRTGNFAGTGTTIYNPNTGASNGTGRTPFPNNVVPNTMINAAAAKMISLIPEPNLAGNGLSNNYFATGNVHFTRDEIDIKINYNPTDKSAVWGRYSIQPTNNFDPQALGAAGGPAIDGGQPGYGIGRIQSLALGATYAITPTLLVDANAGYTRLHLSAENTDINQNFGTDVLNIPGTNGPSALEGGIPAFNITNLTSLGNNNSSSPFLFRDNLFVESANLSWVKGSHNFRFGAEFFHYSIFDIQANSSVGLRGGFTFSGGLTALSGGAAPTAYNAWADFLLGLPTSMSHDYQYIDPAAVIESSFGFYARDQWQVNRKLTVNYGFRYEIYPYAHAEHGIDGIHYDVATNMVLLKGTNVDTGHGYIAPRFGLAYRLNEKTVLRAGYGINTNAESFRNNVQTYPEVLSATYTGANTYSAGGSLVTGIPAFVGPTLNTGAVPLPSNFSTWIYPTPYRRGYAESYNVTIQRDLGKGYSLQAAYVATRDVRPSDGININAAPPNGGKAGQPYYQLYGNPSTFSDMLPIDASKYNSLQMRATHQMHDANIGVAYTFSKAMDAADNEEGSSLTWNWAPIQYRNYAVAGFDRTHNFQTYGTYALPFGKGKNMLSHGLASVLVSGWQANWLLSRESGTPFTVSASGTSLNSPGNSQTANQVLPTVAIPGGHGPGAPYFNINAFAAVTTPTFGNSGRNILRGPGLFSLNTGLFRSFAIRERFNLQFRAEALGVTNTPIFSNPSATFGSSSLGIISTSTGERQIRLALKLRF
ncbi:MAG TPA: TonB-dependent receptor [Bryobacteraceae bacterium]